MSIDDINRIGPSQDVNDPTTLIQLMYDLQQKSNQFGFFLHIIEAQDLDDFTGEPIFNISTPLLLENGSIIEYFASGINIEDDLLVYDKPLWSSGLITTYINLAERFRDYWSGLNDIIDSSGFVKGIDIADEGPTIISGGGQIRTHGSSGNISFEAAFFSPDEPYETPEWSGSGPVNYNSGTYPQLLNETSGLILGLLQRDWNETYHYEKLRNIGFTSSVQFGKSTDFGHPNSKTWVQIHNPHLSSITVNISTSLTLVDGGTGKIYSVWDVDIGQLNSPPTGDSFSFDTYEEINLSGNGSIIQNRSFDIPQDQTAFIRVFSGGSASTTVLNSVTINDRTITYSFP